MVEENLQNQGEDKPTQPDGEVSQDSINDLIEKQMQEAFENSNAEKEENNNTVGRLKDNSSQNENDVNLVKDAKFPEFSGTGEKEERQNIGLLLDVPLPVSIELGRTSMIIEDILNLGPGSVVELNKLAGEPVDLLVNNKLFAKGEVVVVDENFGIRVTSLISPEERSRYE